MSERSIKAYDSWREESQKFEYFMLGLIGAVCAYLAQNLKPQRLGLSPFTFELVALALLVASAIFGFRRIEHNIALLRQTHTRLEWEDHLSQLVANYKGEPLRTNLGDVLTPEKIEQRADALRVAISEADKHQKQSAKLAGRNYHCRNWSLLAGFVVLVVSRILEAYL